MAFSVYQQILRFEVSVDDILLVHVANGEQYFADVKHRNIIAKAPIFSQPIKELTSRTKLEDHVDEDIVLKGSFEGIDEGVVEFTEYLFFEFYMLHLFEVDYVGFRNLLQGEDLLAGPDDLLYPPEGPCPQGLSYLIFGDVVGVAGRRSALGLGVGAFRFVFEGRTYLFFLSFSLQLF